MKVEYHNLYTHFVFTVKDREPLILSGIRERIEKYITGILNRNGCRLYAVYANPDHMHFLVSRDPGMDEARLAAIVAESSAKFISDNGLIKFRFEWQQSCSAFSVSKGDVDRVCKYILNQEKHHKKHTLQDENEAFQAFYQKTISPGKKLDIPPAHHSE